MDIPSLYFISINSPSLPPSLRIWQILKGIIRKACVATSIILITIALDRRHICPELKSQRNNNAKPSSVAKAHPLPASLWDFGPDGSPGIALF